MGLICPWDSSGKNTGVGCHILLQGIITIQGLNPWLLCLLYCRQISLAEPSGKPVCVCVEVSMVEVLEPIPKDTEGCSHIHVQLHTHMCTYIYACTPLHNKNNGTACLKNHRWFLRFERDSKVYLEKSPRMFFAKHEYGLTMVVSPI